MLRNNGIQRDWRNFLPFILKDYQYLGQPEPSSTQQQASTSQQQLQIQPEVPRTRQHGSQAQWKRVNLAVLEKQFRKEFGISLETVTGNQIRLENHSGFKKATSSFKIL